MLDLIKALREKDEIRMNNYDEVKDMSKSVRIISKYPIDIVNHLDALFRHHISEIKRNMSLGEYHADNFFIRLSCSKEKVLISIVYCGWLLNKVGSWL